MSINYFAQATNFESAMSALSASILASDGRDWSRLNVAYSHLRSNAQTFGSELIAAASKDASLVALFRHYRARLNQFERCRVRLAQFAARDFGKEVHPSDML